MEKFEVHIRDSHTEGEVWRKLEIQAWNSKEVSCREDLLMSSKMVIEAFRMGCPGLGEIEWVTSGDREARETPADSLSSSSGISSYNFPRIHYINGWMASHFSLCPSQQYFLVVSQGTITLGAWTDLSMPNTLLQILWDKHCNNVHIVEVPLPPFGISQWWSWHT